MPNNYQRGRAKEYRIKNKYQKAGWIVIRSAGSHSFADLVCIHPKWEVIEFVQVKPRKFSKNQKQKLEKEFENINWKSPMCFFKVI